MSNHRIVYTRPDGGVSVVVPAPSFVAKFRTEADAIAAIRAKDVPSDAVAVVETTTDQLPQRRKWRNAWRLDAGRCVEHMPGCRQMHRERLLRAAKKRLAVLREKRQEAEEDGDTARVALIRQRAKNLRDRVAGMNLEAAQTPDELDAMWDDELEREQ